MGLHLIIIVTALISASTLAGQDDWRLRKDVDGIKAYTREIDWTKFDEYRIESRMKGDISALLAVFKDFDVYAELFDGISDVTTHIDEPDKYLNYITVKAPFPAKNRDGVYLNELSYDEEKKLLHIQVSCVNDFYEPSKKYIQIEHCSGFWNITQLSDGNIDIVHQFVLDPGGFVPSFIINLQTTKNPIKSFKLLKELILLPKYQNQEFEILSK